MHKKASYSMSVYQGQESTESQENGDIGAKGSKRAYISPRAVGALFLCSVVVGKVPPIPGTQDMRDPGVHQAECITAEGSEGMLVVFKDFQAIPEYLISMGEPHSRPECVCCLGVSDCTNVPKVVRKRVLVL